MSNTKKQNPDELSIPEIFELISKKPHDAAFKLFMKHKEVSVPYLKSKLPASFSKRCHWEQIEFLPTEFLDSQFQEQRCDLLLNVPYGKIKSCYIHILFESQRSHDRTMPWRLLKYMVEIWKEVEQKRRDIYQDQKKQEILNKERISIFPLPFIFPIVLYNGKERWTTPTSLAKSCLIECPHGLSPFSPDFQHILTDLVQMKEEDFEQYKNFTHCYHILKLQKHSHSGEVLPFFESVIEYLQWCFQNNPELSHTIFTLAFYLEGKDRQNQDNVATFLKNKVNQGENMPILLEELMKKGKEEGLEEGKKQGLILSAQKMLQKGFSTEIISECTGLSITEIQKLQEQQPDQH